MRRVSAPAFLPIDDRGDNEKGHCLILRGEAGNGP